MYNNIITKSQMRIGTALTLLAFLEVISSHENCWEDAYGRGVGKPIHACQPGFEENGLLCYPLCKDGYYGVGPVCW
jgi:hypothetical protein